MKLKKKTQRKEISFTI